MSGTATEWSGLNEIKKILRSGDTFIVWRLDRLGRSLRDLIDWIAYLENYGIALRSLHESIDTSTSTGKLVFHLFGGLAEYDSAGEPTKFNKEANNDRLSTARARGRLGGRPKQLNADKQQLAVQLYEAKKRRQSKRFVRCLKSASLPFMHIRASAKQ